jgi:RNA polymerase sigma-70 factor (ECF subfamily)
MDAAGTSGMPRDDARLRGLFDAHYDFVWRSLRRLGVSSEAVDDAAQEVFLVLSRKLDDVPVGKEKAFLFGTALRVASDARRARVRRRVVADEPTVEGAPDLAHAQDEELDRARARALIERVLDEMDLDLRAVFVLYELEEMTMAEIAACLDLAPGTVASRLRRAREDWQARVARLRARAQHRGVA